jgi:eukaryotic-like serine/threonine-protein kinase
MPDDPRLQQLLQDWQDRAARGQDVPAAELCRDCPELAAELERRISILRWMGGATRELGAVPATLSLPAGRETVVATATVQIAGYEILGQLGRGGMGVVYAARHLQRGHRVALKTLTGVDGAALHRFKREFRALADIHHPNLVGLHSLESDGHWWFVTMDLVEGVPFLQCVRPGGTLDEARLRPALAQLVRGVMALHGHHIIHRDLKPSNVLVTADGHVVVLDFGLVLELDRAEFGSRSTQHVAGTPVYMAPEQAAGGPVSPATDWYAVGVMLYEALSGSVPFSGPILQVLRDKERLDPPPLPDEPRLPEDLARLCLRLLAREPRQRPDALEIAKAVAASVEHAATVAPRSGHPLVGRGQHLAALEDAYRQLQRRREPLTLFLTGRSGEGKSTLGERFLTPLHEDGRAAVMSGRCYDRESVPFKALDTLIDSLASHLRALRGEEAALLMPDDIGALVRVFPVLQRVDVVAKAADTRLAGLEEQQVRQRAFRALRSLLTRMGRGSLIVWFIDDLQWGDADSALALFEALRPPEAPPVLFLGAYRSDETEGSAFLRTWKELQRQHGVSFADREVHLGPLTVAECTELVTGLLGRDDEVIHRRAAEFARETHGNPFLLIELVGCFDPDTDSFEPLPLHEVLTRKLGRLPATAAPLLEVVAVSGQALALEEASQAAGHVHPPMSLLLHMRQERLVRLTGPEGSPLVDTYHDRVRETVLEGLGDGRRRALHAALAGVIEKAVGGVPDEQVAALQRGERTEAPPAVPRAYDLAYHLDGAGERQKAWVYGLLAAEQARRQLAFGVALEQFALARRNAEGAADAVRSRIAAGWGETLMLLGRYDEATAELDAAARITDDPVAKAVIEGYQGEIALRLGRAGQSAARCASALRRLGHGVPQSRPGWAWGLLRELFVHGVHRLFPKRLHAGAATGPGELAGRLFARLAYAYSCQNSLKTLWAVYAGMNHAERLPPSPALAFCYSGYGAMSMWAGRFARATAYLDRSLELRRACNDLWGIANSLYAHGFSLYAAGRFEEAVVKLDESVELYHKAGDPWEANANRLHWALCLDKLGTPAPAIASARAKYAEGLRLGDDNSTHYGLCVWSIAARGNLPFEELKGCVRPLADNVVAMSMLGIAEGYWHWFHGRTAEALRVCEEAYRLVIRSLAVNHLTAPTLPYLVTALRRHAEATEGQDPKQAQRLRRRAFRLAKWAARLRRFAPAHSAHALRELSFAYAARGRLQKALRLAEKSCAVAEAQKARSEYAESLLLRGRLAQRLGLPGAEDQIRTAEAALASLSREIETATRPPTVG